jgi:hypothetical protein
MNEVPPKSVTEWRSQLDRPFLENEIYGAVAQHAIGQLHSVGGSV